MNNNEKTEAEKAAELERAMDWYRTGLELSDEDEKLEAFANAIEIEPKFSAAYQMRGGIFMDRGEYENAIAEFSNIIEREPYYGTTVPVYNLRGSCYFEIAKSETEEDGYEYLKKAIEDFDTAIMIHNHPHLSDDEDENYGFDSYVNRGMAYSYMNEHEKAIKDFTTALKANYPDNPLCRDAYYERGLEYNFTGNYEAAIEDMNKAEELGLKTASVYNERGNSYKYTGEYEKAVDDFNKAIEMEPDDADYYANRGCTYSAMREYELALKDFNKSLQLDPENIYAYNNRGCLYYKTYRYKEAIEDFSYVLSIDPSNKKMYENLAIVEEAYKESLSNNDYEDNKNESVPIKKEQNSDYVNSLH